MLSVRIDHGQNTGVITFCFIEEGERGLLLLVVVKCRQLRDLRPAFTTTLLVKGEAVLLVSVLSNNALQKKERFFSHMCFFLSFVCIERKSKVSPLPEDQVHHRGVRKRDER
jgi:hypothetical protein